MLRIVADENIPLVAEVFAGLGPVELVPARAIDAARVARADVLLVRSVTRVDAALVAGSRLRFVGSATIGTDHVDIAALAHAGIRFRHAPGSNADAVVEYVLAALLAVAVRRGEPLHGKVAGIVGCGSIGGRLAERLPALGMLVLCNDPPLAQRAEQEGISHRYIALDRLLAESDVVTLHVPLTRAGPHPTLRLLDDAALAALRPGAWLLNTSRGAVVSGRALHVALTAGIPRAAVLDVWEHEPEPDPALVELVAIATPHIAGHSWDGKVAGTLMLRDALMRELDLRPPDDGEPSRAAPVAEPSLPMPLAQPLSLVPPAEPGSTSLADVTWLHSLARQMYDIGADDTRMRALPAGPERATAFHALRRDYPRRHAFVRHALPAAAVPARLRRQVVDGLGVRLT
ncbi:MAG TPA: 4-phosphoerythronate dehydrogenase [Longimicrobiales bacterium]|nr:4-phosphoerythronate dehydrogenase [Longimicrobiales bacterium]